MQHLGGTLEHKQTRRSPLPAKIPQKMMCDPAGKRGRILSPLWPHHPEDLRPRPLGIPDLSDLQDVRLSLQKIDQVDTRIAVDDTGKPVLFGERRLQTSV